MFIDFKLKVHKPSAVLNKSLFVFGILGTFIMCYFLLYFGFNLSWNTALLCSGVSSSFILFLWFCRVQMDYKILNKALNNPDMFIRCFSVFKHLSVYPQTDATSLVVVHFLGKSLFQFSSLPSGFIPVEGTVSEVENAFKEQGYRKKKGEDFFILYR